MSPPLHTCTITPLDPEKQAGMGRYSLQNCELVPAEALAEAHRFQRILRSEGSEPPAEVLRVDLRARQRSPEEGFEVMREWPPLHPAIYVSPEPSALYIERTDGTLWLSSDRGRTWSVASEAQAAEVHARVSSLLSFPVSLSPTELKAFAPVNQGAAGSPPLPAAPAASAPFPPAAQRYKFRSLKVYGSDNPLYNSEKRYRQVYEQSEVTYLYMDLSLYNKLFDEQDWSISWQLKLFSDSGRLISTIDKEAKVSRDQNIVYLRHGYGSATPGQVWTKGRYRWEAWSEGTKIAETPVYVVSHGLAQPGKNPYFELESVRMFEGPVNAPAPESRKYLRQIKSATSHYLWAELKAKNLIRTEDWPCELFFNFHYDTGELNWQNQRFVTVSASEEHFTVDVGVGNATAGDWWKKEAYRLEIVFLDQLLAIVPFTVGDEEIQSDRGTQHIAADSLPAGLIPTLASPAAAGADAEPTEDAIAVLDNMVGLTSFKERLHKHARYLKFLELRSKRGLESDKESRPNLHAAFLGNPGTGKSTVAKLLGRIYQKLGLLSKGHLVSVDRADIVGRFIGQTAPAVREAIDKARGGVLLIDEAYSLFRSNEDAKDFGREVIEMLVKEMSDGAGDLCIVCAGYPTEMETFLSANPGLRSRFGMIHTFEDYLPQELIRIADHAAQKQGVTFDPAARELLDQSLVEAYRARDRAFGNARYVVALIDRAKMNLGLRLIERPDADSIPPEELSRITREDVAQIFVEEERQRPKIPIDEEELIACLGELRGMIGLTEVKRDIYELVKLVRFYLETGRDISRHFSLHAVLTGNPGTGKTTVARILARIYKALGVLERGHLVECDRQTLVAGFVGQTAIKTGQVLDRAMGGMLFVDEAYSLAGGGGNDFGEEAIATLLKRMEDRRREFALVLAGYTRPMQELLDSNPGLRSRFDRYIKFPDYSSEELLEIAVLMLRNEGVEPSGEGLEELARACRALGGARSETFGNAREVRRLVDAVLKKQNLRLAAVPAAQRTPALLAQLLFEDVHPVAEALLPPEEQREIGFTAKRT